MKEYNVDPTDPEVKELSYVGFNNILENMADISDASLDDISEEKKSGILKDGMDHLNWYFDNFDYGPSEDSNLNFYRFLDRMHGQFERSDETWQNLYQEFLNQRQEYLDLFPATPEEEKKIENTERMRISRSKEMSYDEFIEQMNIIINTFGKNLDLQGTDMKFFPDKDEKNPNPKDLAERQKYTKDEKCSYMLEKIFRFKQEVEVIKSVDPGANFYIETFDSGEIDENGNHIKKIPRYPYLVVRFGNPTTQLNNVYAEATAFDDAFYAWHGKDDEWKDVFAGSKSEARAREEVRCIRHGKRGKSRFAVGSLQDVYDEAHNFAPIPTDILGYDDEYRNEYNKSGAINPAITLSREEVAESAEKSA